MLHLFYSAILCMVKGFRCDNQIHPKHYCRACLSKLQRYKSFLHKAAGPPLSPTLPPPTNFEPHGPNCAVCSDSSTESSTELLSKELIERGMDLSETLTSIDDNNNITIDFSDIDNFNFNTLSPIQIKNLAYQLGKSQHDLVKDETIELSTCKDLNYMIQLVVKLYANERNAAALGNPNKPQDVYKICKTVEAVMNLSTLKFLLPLHYKVTILMYSLTKSKTALSILSASTAHGS